ncbi:MAG: alpha-N-acetylglucosaminidase [Eubacterium sp.]|nr:alpha-N-acetylglucosaminidase [Eubacterium sp.]
MDAVIAGFLERNLPDFVHCFHVEIDGTENDYFSVTANNDVVSVSANCYVSAFHGIYCYLKKYCRVQLSWCGNQSINIDKLVMFNGEYKKKIKQKFRVYMNYCTLNYSMCWWDFERWEKEIDFMAMNGINMPLAVIGSEAVLFETLLEFGFSEREALDSISGPAFWAWQLMTNITGYLPPPSKKYVYERLALGKKLLERYTEFGMYPIQQGFSGHVPALMKKKQGVKLYMQRGWNGFEKTAQLNPIDPFFKTFGTAYLNKLCELMGFYGYIACDPFHEGTPPKQGKKYLYAVGKAISDLYAEFDESTQTEKKTVWVMQSWSMRTDIVKAVDKDRLLILDINSQKTSDNNTVKKYPVVAGMLHNFGGKNAMQGKLKLHCKNSWLELKQNGVNVVGSGMFMEGIEQNPVLYDLQFELLTVDSEMDFDIWLRDYIERRYGGSNSILENAWDLLLQSCYKDSGYEENEVGSAAVSRPQMIPFMTGPCCYAKPFYDTAVLEKAACELLAASSDFSESDGYQFDLCDVTRQVLSNRFYINQLEFADAYRKKDISAVKSIAEKQLELLKDLDYITSFRSEMCLSRWLYDAQSLASDEEEKRYFSFNAKVLITLWGDINRKSYLLYDYSWREWSGLIKGYYYERWNMFYGRVIHCLENGKRFKDREFNNYGIRMKHLKYPLGKEIGEFERKWCEKYEEISQYPADRNVVSAAEALLKKYI